MRKQVYLAVLGISIVVSAVSLGVALTRYLGLRAYSPMAPPRAAAPDPAGQTVAATPLEQWNNLFAPGQGMKLPSRLPTANAQSASQAPRSAFVLVGTIVSSSPGASRAILWANGMKLPKAFREGEEVEPGAVLSSVERDKAWLARGTEREKLDLLPVGSKVRAPLSPPVPAQATVAPGATRAAGTSAPPGGDIQVTRLADNRFSIDQAGVEQLSGNINQFMTQIRLIPFFEGNKSAGYRIAAIRPGTTFERLGFQGGDVLQQVNGLDVSSPEKLYTIFQNLKDQKTVSVNILRQGQKNTLTYEIR